jgi:hypothetical protein
MYTMHIEKPAYVVTPHGFHLGTDRATAERFVLERLQADKDIVSIALRRNGKLDRFYDFRGSMNDG